MLRIDGLSVSYGETLILRDVTLDIRPGQVVCLMGRNGVGKTTLLKSIMGLLRPQSGRILVQDRDMTRFSPDQRARAGLGYVPQGREIFPQLTVLENLQVGTFANRSLGGAIPPEIYSYFPVLKTLLDRRGGLLSGGQQQQLAIARALVAKPKLILLDEPTEGIQPNVITLIGEVLKGLKAKGDVSILLVEQYLEFALELADYYYVMEKGSVVLQGADAASDRASISQYLAF
ncbi:MAG: urea ABC transporter ATP-binding subunit UrtE [Gemmataceae bacterium]